MINQTDSGRQSNEKQYNGLLEFDDLFLGSELDEEFKAGDLPSKVREAFNMGALAWPLAVQRAIQAGIRDSEDLADMVFFMHHPERKGRALDPGEPDFKILSKEWKAWRTLIIPLLENPPLPSGTKIKDSFILEAVESPGGGRIKDKSEPPKSDRVKVKGYKGRTVWLHRLAAKALQAMIQAARSDGIAKPLLEVVSGFRSIASQERLWKIGLKKHGSAKEARKWIAPPGGSAHHSGRAVDLWMGLGIGKRNAKAMRSKPVYKWMVVNAKRFGFYPYSREPWHWEYNPPASGGSLETIADFDGDIFDEYFQYDAPFFPSEPEAEFNFSIFPNSILKVLRKGSEKIAIRLAITFGFRNKNDLSNLVFFSRHPERKGKKLSKSEKNFKALSIEWLNIHDRLVHPILTGVEIEETQNSVNGGLTDENILTNQLFFKRHKHRKGKPLRRGEPNFKQLSREWFEIRDGVVRPVICKAFFKEYELRFNPGSSTFGIPANSKMTATEKASRTSDVNKMVSALLSRRDKRASDSLIGRIPPMKSASSALMPVIRRLSTAQLELYREFFPDKKGNINFPAFQQCFEQFTNGELRNPAVGSGFGEPDGGFYFMFAEFAFICIDSKISLASWVKLLRSFVKTQEIFMHVYRPSPVSPPPKVNAALPKKGSAVRSLDDYKFSNFKELGSKITVGEGQSNELRKKALRRKYDKMNINSLRKAARNNMLRAQRMS